MIKRTLCSLAILASLSACNDDNDSNNSTQPEIKKPEIMIVGHRGASALRPEHTLESYQKAMNDGADFIEPDLVPTKDGYLVARHENEIGGTSNISTLPQFADREKTKSIDGVIIKGWFTEDFTLAELNLIKARERIPKIRPQNTQYNDLYNIPTLEQIIELADAHYKKTGKIVGLYIETKHPSYFSQPSINLAMEDKLLSTLSKYSYTRDIAPVYLQSFEVKNLKYLSEQLKLHKSLKHAKIIQLFDSKTNFPADGSTQTYGEMATASGLKNVAVYADGVGPSKTYILPNTQPATPTSFVKDAHAVGLKVHPYTLRPENEFLPNYLDCSAQVEQRCEAGALQEYEIFFKAGVDGVFTDDPALGRKALNQYLSTLPKK
ncbi:glycerophosphodiester phosphodiesterase [Acinetobacter sp. TGL-Y2]|uniref:glycerophosphodiester phosphodiesterase n=1 Tax=Acinetobacter sp. TGL-Y2 TaxID=1407071 RepID=UPI0007A67BD0|nr:glycerophosphodiester phosphodiesterase [Acinetobacter sp. TGL-Y2]AMW80409.1 glycerophosphodiester phosphodiesterase [Acinetobacter sp. TGL-Y2]